MSNQDVQEPIINDSSAVYADVTGGHFPVNHERPPKVNNVVGEGHYAAIDHTVGR